MKGFNSLALFIFMLILTVSIVLAIILGVRNTHPLWIL